MLHMVKKGRPARELGLEGGNRSLVDTGVNAATHRCPGQLSQ